MSFGRMDLGKSLFSLYLFFLPFTNVFVLNLGFPLKISEVLLFLLLFIQLALFRKDIQFARSAKEAYLLLMVFFALSFLSTLINSFWQYDYRLNNYEDVRIGYIFDSFLKLFYVLLSILSFFLLKDALSSEGKAYVRMFLTGGVLACLFCWYLFFATFLHYTPSFFNNSADPPQMFFIPFVGDFYRSGTFKEGNHMGLFLLVCVFLAHQMRSKLAYFFAITIITTFSTPAFIGCVIYIFLYYILVFIRRRAYSKLLITTLVVLVAFSLVFSNEFVRSFTINKLSETEEASDVVSKNDRLELSQTGIRIALHNPFIGVGLSNYGRHYIRFTESYEGLSNIKRIANNVYVEISSEVGLFGLLLFLLFLLLVFSRVHDLKARLGFCISLLYLNVYPTFTLLFLWFYWAFLFYNSANNYNSLSKENERNEDYCKQ